MHAAVIHSQGAGSCLLLYRKSSYTKPNDQCYTCRTIIYNRRYHGYHDCSGEKVCCGGHGMLSTGRRPHKQIVADSKSWCLSELIITPCYGGNWSYRRTYWRKDNQLNRLGPAYFIIIWTYILSSLPEVNAREGCCQGRRIRFFRAVVLITRRHDCST